MPRGKRNFDNEQPGTRYGRRVVLRTETIVHKMTKYVGLWVRCDCGGVDLVRKSMLVTGRADKCKNCENTERAEFMQGMRFGEQWSKRRAHHQSKQSAIKNY